AHGPAVKERVKAADGLHHRFGLAQDRGHRLDVLVCDPAPLLLRQVKQGHEGRTLLGIAGDDLFNLLFVLFDPRRSAHRSTSPKTGSTVATTATRSATSSPRTISGMAKTL